MHTYENVKRLSETESKIKTNKFDYVSVKVNMEEAQAPNMINVKEDNPVQELLA